MSLENLDQLKSINDLDLLWDQAHCVAKQYGINSMMYAFTPSLYSFQMHGIEGGGLCKTSYPEEYLDFRGVDEMLRNDFTTIYCLENDVPIGWQDPYMFLEATDDQLHQLEIDKSFGIEFGVTIPLFTTDLKGFGGMGLCAGECTKKEFDDVWEEKGSEIQMLASAIDVCMRKHHIEEFLNLDSEEKEVLKWLAVGLQIDEIAYRLNFSPRKLDHMIASVKIKLKAKNNIQAVAKAIIYGLIEL